MLMPKPGRKFHIDRFSVISKDMEANEEVIGVNVSNKQNVLDFWYFLKERNTLFVICKVYYLI